MKISGCPRGEHRSRAWLGISGMAILTMAGATTLSVLSPPVLHAQLASVRSGPSVPPRVFLDCQGFSPCNRNLIRTEIQFVNWAQDRADSDVHVIVTGENVGGGGRRFTLDFIGRGDMGHLSDQLTYTTSGTDVQRETQDGITQALRLGLMRYAVQAGLGNRFDVRFAAATAQNGNDASSAAAAPTRDRWNFWTYRVGLSSNMDVSQNRSNYRINPSIGGDRVTEDWKLNFSYFSQIRWEKIVVPATETREERIIRNDLHNWSASGLVVHSLSPNLSTGVSAGAGSSVSGNTKLRGNVGPAIEWNYYPYAESSRRQLIAHYAAGVRYNSYRAETVFGVMEQTIPLHQLGIQYRAVAPWGNAGIGIEASQFLHESGLYNLGASGNLSFRVIRGLDLSFSASGSRVADQIHIPAGQFSEEDILLGRVTLPTSFDYSASVGFSYRFGSTFANIVNTRFPPSVR